VRRLSSLRVKLVLSLVLLSATATIAIGAWSYAATKDQLYAEIDRSLDAAVRELGEGPPFGGHGPRPEFDGDIDEPGQPENGLPRLEQLYVQIVDANGEVVTRTSPEQLPNTDLAAQVAQAPRGSAPSWSSPSVDGESYRMLIAPLGDGRAAQVARSLAETERVLDSLRDRTLVAVVAVSVAAAVVGWLIARQVTRRLVHLTASAEEVAATGRLDVPVPTGGGDEAGRLGTAFDQMLRALARSRDAQQQLVQDAGHELRTPLTSLQTNISVLRRHEQLPADTRDQVLRDLDEETHELTVLVNELVDLATDQHDAEAPEELEVAPLVERAADRARRRTGRRVVVRADASRVVVQPAALERAVTNLLDNAAKFSPPGSPIELDVAVGTITVADRGPGIAAEDRARVFDRFYRTVDARGAPGSGLGLAIVRDVAERHGGEVVVREREGGGAIVGLRLPVVGPPAAGPPT
jgi:two-component system sensor histidine kinase MprB